MGDLRRWLLSHRQTEISSADYPLFIKFIQEGRDFHGRVHKKAYPNGFRVQDSGYCAYASVHDDDSTLIELQVPQPDFCPYDIYNRIIMLINHEMMHIILEDVLDSEENEDLEASDLWDHPKTVKKFNKWFPDVYCHCGINPLNLFKCSSAEMNVLNPV